MKTLSLSLWCLSQCVGGQHPRQPDIILILADDIGWNDVPWHNPTLIAPHLHHLARSVDFFRILLRGIFKITKIK